MRDINKVILVGRLGSNPILRSTKKGLSVAQFPVATSRRRFREDENENKVAEQETQWHRIVAWGKRAEVSARYLTKGSSVYVEGFIQSNEYKDKEGNKRYSFEVYADQIIFLGRGRNVSAVAATTVVDEAIPEAVPA